MRWSNDERLQVVVAGTDLIAKDIPRLYHISCYRDTTRAKTLDRLREKQEETGGSTHATSGPSKRTQIRTEISQQPTPLPLPLKTWNIVA